MLEILFEPIKNKANLTRRCLITLAGAFIITFVILTIALMANNDLQTQNDTIKAQRQIAESSLRALKTPEGAYERVPGGWRNVESGKVYKNGK